ncbi:MAG: DUF2723 domain-containing protein [Planctomycetota bacterium]|nr:DUF2723 domain-containing protein [Planctomycetota bacterium]
MVAFVAAAVFLMTAQRGPAWQDSGIFQWRMHTFDLTGHMGLALAHPLIIILGGCVRVIPLGAEVWRYNALSAVAAAVAAANLAVIVRRLTPKVPVAAYFAAGAFVLSHTVWWLATITESHALLAALMTAELLALISLLRRPRISMVLLLGLFNGLGVATHNLALLAAPAYASVVMVLVWRKRISWCAAPLFAAAWCIGAMPMIWMTIQMAGQAGAAAAVRSALFGRSWRGQVLGGSAKAAVLGLGYIIYNFPNFVLPLSAVGLWRLRQRVGAGLAAALAYILVIHFVFAVRYAVSDQFMFFVPFYLMVTMLAGLGFAHLCENRRRWLKIAAVASLLLGPVAYAIAPSAANAMKLPLPGGRRTLPFRDDGRYWLTPWKHNENSAGRFARTAMEQLPDQSIVFADSTSYWPLRWVAEVEGAGPKLRLVGGTDTDMLKDVAGDPAGFLRRVERGENAVFVVSKAPGYCPKPLLPYVEDKPAGVLYRIRPPADR